MAGFSDTAAIWLAAVTAGAQSVGVCIGIYFIEVCGRRTLVLSSLGMVSVALVLLGLGFHLHDGVVTSAGGGLAPEAEKYGYVVVGTMMAYLFTFGVGMSSVPWTVNAEIYPNHARSLGTSASTTVNWIGNVAVSATFLTLASDGALGRAGAFWLYAGIAWAGWFWLFCCMPETKGLALEEIELLFAREGDPVRPGEDEVAYSGTARSKASDGGGGGGGGDGGAVPRRAGGFALLESQSPSRGGGAGAAADWIDPSVAGGGGGSSPALA